MIPFGTEQEQAERRRKQNQQAKQDQQRIDMGLARELVYSYQWQAENAKTWFAGVYANLTKKHGKQYAEHIRSLMTIVKNENNALLSTASTPSGDGHLPKDEASSDGRQKVHTGGSKPDSQPASE